VARGGITLSLHPAPCIEIGARLRRAVDIHDFEMLRIATEDCRGNAEKSIGGVGELDVDVSEKTSRDRKCASFVCSCVYE